MSPSQFCVKRWLVRSRNWHLRDDTKTLCFDFLGKHEVVALSMKICWLTHYHDNIDTYLMQRRLYTFFPFQWISRVLKSEGRNGGDQLTRRRLQFLYSVKRRCFFLKKWAILGHFFLYFFILLEGLGSSAVWPEKNRRMSIKVAQNDFTRKMKDFDTFTKFS